MKTKTQSHTKKRGFSLLEILIVLAIITAIVAIAASSMGSTTVRSKAIANEGSLSSMQQAVDRFVAEYGSIPTADWGTGAGGTIMTTAEKTALIESIAGIYSGATTSLATHSANAPTYALKGAAADVAAKFTALVVNSSASPRVIILQYRNEATGHVINGNHTVSSAFLAAGTDLTGSNYYADSDFTTSAWPF